MKKQLLFLILGLLLVGGPLLPARAGADPPRTFMGIVGENGYVAVGSNGRVHYTISNDVHPAYYYGYCGHHHRRHRCRYVAPPRYKHHKKHKHKKHHYKPDKHHKHHKKHKKHHRHHDDD